MWIQYSLSCPAQRDHECWGLRENGNRTRPRNRDPGSGQSYDDCDRPRTITISGPRASRATDHFHYMHCNMPGDQCSVVWSTKSSSGWTRHVTYTLLLREATDSRNEYSDRVYLIEWNHNFNDGVCLYKIFYPKIVFKEVVLTDLSDTIFLSNTVLLINIF